MFRRLLLLFVLGLGCAKPSVQPVEGTVLVTGTVTFDGQPLADGRISFIDSEGKLPREYMASVQDGQFEIHAPPGLQRVEIRAAEQTTSTDIVTDFKQPIPPRYNDNSELTAELKDDAPNVLTFELTSKGE